QNHTIVLEIFLTGSCAEEIPPLLIEQGNANVNAQDNNGNTPLHDAAASGMIWSSQILLQHNALAYLQNNDQKTPMQLAAENGHEKLANMLQNAQKRQISSLQQSMHSYLPALAKTISEFAGHQWDIAAQSKEDTCTNSWCHWYCKRTAR
ncbi:MAG: ankyrin repeat domain-containing protein, partial [Myxococcota bacterium]